MISLRCIFPKASWAAVFNSWSVEEGRSVRSSAWPSGKATFILSIERRGWDVVKILTTLQNISNESPLHTLSPTDSCSHFCKAVEAKCFLLWMTKEQWRIGKPENQSGGISTWLSTANWQTESSFVVLINEKIWCSCLSPYTWQPPCPPRTADTRLSPKRTNVSESRSTVFDNDNFSPSIFIISCHSVSIIFQV